MSNFVESDYTRWDSVVVVWDSIEDFEQASAFIDGVHVIRAAPGPSLEILVRNANTASNSSVLPVFFTGAVDGRSGKIGPFFSGDGLGTQGSFGFVAVSDPSLNLDASLGLAWYAGNKYQDVQSLIRRSLTKISSVLDTELLLVGGSGGGFAALFLGYQLGKRCSVLVWNPQTDIFKYNPAASKNFFRHAYGPEITAALEAPHWESSTKDFLANSPITHSLLESVVSEHQPNRLLIFQNSSDWHVSYHLAPLLDRAGFNYAGRGVYQRNASQMAVIANFGAGHAALPADAVLEGILAALDPDTDVVTVAQRVCIALPASERPYSVLPRDLRWMKTRIMEELSLSDAQSTKGLVLELSHGSVPIGYGGMRYEFFSKSAGGELKMEASSLDPVFTYDFAGVPISEVGVLIRDGFLNEILVLRQKL